MIKINLARKRKAVPGAAKQSLFSGKSFEVPSFRDIDWKTSPIPRTIISLLLIYFAQSQEETMKQERLAEVEVKISQVQEQQDEINKKMAKVKGFEPLKKQLEDDERTIQTKLTVINTLMEDREAPSRLMKQISQAIPEDVWITSLSAKEDKVQIAGGSSNYNLVSDFMNGLGGSSLLAEISLSQITENLKDGIKYQQFDISAKRRGHK